MTDINSDTRDDLAADLRQAVGKGNAITSGELARRHVPSDGEANPATREAVKDIMRERGLPIIGSSQGYYIPRTRGPIDEEIESLSGRIDGIRERQQLLRDNWADWAQRTATDGGTQSMTDIDPDDTTLSEAEFDKVRSDDTLQVTDFARGGGDE